MATYYIDYANGNDTTGDGSTGTPWKTLGKFLTAAANGDTCLVRGDDSEMAVFVERNKSTAKTDLTIRADTGHTPVFTAATQKTAASFSKTAGQTNVYEAAYTGDDYGVWHGSTLLAEVADLATCDSTTNSYYEPNAGTIYVNVGGGAPSTVYIVASAQRILTSTGSGLTWDGVNCQWFAMALDMDAAGCTIQNSTFRYTSAPFPTYFVVQAKNATATITGNTFDVGATVYSNGSDGGVVKCNAASSSATISNNTISATANDGEGIAVWGGTGHTISGNTISGFGNGMRIDGDAGGVAYQNTISDCAHGFVGFVASHTGTWSMYRNVCYFTTGWSANGSDGGEHGIIFHSQGTINLYHNIVAYLSRRIGADGGEAYYLASTTGGGTFTLRNNVAYSCEEGIGVYGGTQTLDLDYTGFYLCDTNYFSIDPGDQGANDVTADPLFTDAANHDFTLTASSPYKDAGVAVTGINDDYSGTAPDIGRWEFEGAAVPIIMHHRRQQGMS